MNAGVISRRFPFVTWVPELGKGAVRADLEAGLIGSVLVLPQAIALAALAGMPPEYGIYTSIIPVIIAALWGSSWHTVAGPNTALSVLILLTVSPLAEVGGAAYIGYVLALTLMAGILQLAIGLLRATAVLDFISGTVISAIMLAVALIILVSSAGGLLGVETGSSGSFLNRATGLFVGARDINIPAAFIGIATVVSGLLARMYWKRYVLMVAIITGTLCYLVLTSLAPGVSGTVERLGSVPIGLLPFSVPAIDLENNSVLQVLVPSAVSIAFLGLMQTVVISRSIAAKSGQKIDVNQEAVGQGLANMVAPFLSGFAGSGSFNRSAANYNAGARTPFAAIVASVLLGVQVVIAGDVIAFIPVPALAGILVLVGLGMIDIRMAVRILKSRNEAIIFLVTFICALGAGLNAGVLAGVLASLAIYLWLASTPKIHFHNSRARDGRSLTIVTIDGGLFFGSAYHVERALAAHAGEAKEGAILVLHTDHMTYLDIPGSAMITNVALRWKKAGGEFYIFINRDNIPRMLELSGFMELAGKESVIYEDMPHPVKDILYPYHCENEEHGVSPATGTDMAHAGSLNMDALEKRLRMNRLFGRLSTAQLRTLLAESEVKFAFAGDILVMESDVLGNHLMLVDGILEAQRIWTTQEGIGKSHTWRMKPEDTMGTFGILVASTRNVRVRAVTNIRYIEIDADMSDGFLSLAQQLSEEVNDDPVIHSRMQLLCHVSALSHLPLQNMSEVLKRFAGKPVKAGEIIVTQGEEGDAYYVIEDGQARVVKTDPFTDNTATVDYMGPGDAFGEEALLQGGYRNATINMTTPGNLLVLTKTDFDELVEPVMAQEVDAEQARKQINGGSVKLIDCRYDMEFEESRIPGAIHVALDRIRCDLHKFEPDTEYIVYCRSGRRSLAATFLLGERNIKAVSLKGGIKEWPFDVDARPIESPESEMPDPDGPAAV